MSTVSPPRIVVLVSGEGSNFEAIAEAIERGDVVGRIVAVISNRPQARALARAGRHGLPTEVVDHTAYSGREAFDTALAMRIDAHGPDLVVLAGFMRILTPSFVDHYLGRMLNIHPSLLPAYPGLDTHARVLADGMARHGASVHFVTRELDGGPVVLQGAVRIGIDDTPARLAKRVQVIEHRLYPQAVAWFTSGRLHLSGHRAILDGIPLDTPRQLDPSTEEASPP
ncbi:phosphoribosylglycinamide formyltransferase [Acidihalobacter yilgarnensis]|uniref:Phosphoribosylglycinamide formyltransferase n=1 Tax=Acidihalobacter yilgarnensis TaxID=2819280 RepID=A0A1D8IQ27_9GAMM|nr:phosphoribosylglycinamide formyltransferase [Acidihalobacter yilgarnensis]AOU98608.1 phosphoribosylglycinamide formyltransferase [Acidihalobacter yilgarnensis]